MSREAWGDPPEAERESCPYCGGTHYMAGCDHCDAVKAKCAATFEVVQLRAALLNCARQAEALKRDCGMDPESKQAVRNAQYQNISTTAHIALGTIRGAAHMPGMAAEAEELKAAQEADELRALADSEGTRAVEYLRRARKAEAAVARFTPLRAKGVVDADDNLDCWDTAPFEICHDHVAALNEKDPAAMWRVVDLYAVDLGPNVRANLDPTA